MWLAIILGVSGWITWRWYEKWRSENDDIIAEYLDNLKGNVCEVTFNKVNGDQRVMTCTIKEDMFTVKKDES